MILKCMIETAHLNGAVVGKGILPFQRSFHLKPNGKHQNTACTHKLCQGKEDPLYLGRLRACYDVFADIFPRRYSPP
jgi:NADH:ubiquinone oxidoreductase subunit E